MTAYYNENAPYAAQWLRNLIAAGRIAPGDVDERSIEDVTPNELTGYTQCHFFAGIGVWSHALRVSGWPDDRPVWTGSCPCQPFSAAGKGAGLDDERHLWPAWHHLVAECQPDVVFGEQVSSKSGLGWFDVVQADLEATGYAAGALDTCAAGVGAPHWRQRLYFAAERLANSNNTRPQGRCQRGHGADELATGPGGVVDPADALHGHWRNPDWLYCTDGKWRPVEPGTFPLAHGAPQRVGRLRAYGNAIVVDQAVAFIEAYMMKNVTYLRK